jgi:hypothetical protein
MSASKPLVVPAKVPWESLKGKQLEECLYWLLDSMGARDLQWRIGGSGGGAADQGRDLEATFYLSDPDGEIRPQRWWVEAKGRGATVEKEAVMSAAHNASAHSEVDVLVITTNTQFSNPTIDWVKEWNAGHPKPKVRLWDRSTLERHLCAHPRVVARLFAQALNAQGCLAFLTNQFWNNVQMGDASTLKVLWKERDNLDWDVQSRIALIASEVKNGDVTCRSWGATLDGKELKDVFQTALVNWPLLLMRGHDLGVDLRFYSALMAYLLLCMLRHFKASSLAESLESFWADKDEESATELRRIFIEPMVERLRAELFDVCQRNCLRVSIERSVLTEDEVENYWKRFEIAEPLAEEKKEGRFFIESNGIECKAGFPVSDQKGCPYMGEDGGTVDNRLNVIQKTILARYPEYSEKRNDPLRRFLR